MDRVNARTMQVRETVAFMVINFDGEALKFPSLEMPVLHQDEAIGHFRHLYTFWIPLPGPLM